MPIGKEEWQAFIDESRDSEQVARQAMLKELETHTHDCQYLRLDRMLHFVQRFMKNPKCKPNDDQHRVIGMLAVIGLDALVLQVGSKVIEEWDEPPATPDCHYVAQEDDFKD